MKTLATQRSLAYLKKEGWVACVVEKWIPPRGSMKFGVRKDVWGFGDIIACHTNPPNIALVQCCPGASHAEHKAKIVAISEFETWKRAGGRVLLMSWAKQGPRGKRKHWKLREEEL